MKLTQYLYFLISLAMPALGVVLGDSTVYLDENTSRDIYGNGYGVDVLRIYCYAGTPRSLSKMFESVEVVLGIDSEDYSMYDGKTSQHVLEHYHGHRPLLSLKRHVQLDPFDHQCIGIATNVKYNVNLSRVRLDCWRLIQMIAGILTFCSASWLAKNILPVQFLFCQRMFQVMGCTLIYLSTSHRPASTALVLILIVVNYLRGRLMNWTPLCISRSPRPWLNQDDYYLQTQIETGQSLQKLRQFMLSTDSPQSLVNSLHDPERFSQFMAGSPHLGDAEINEYSRHIEDAMENEVVDTARGYLQRNLYYRPSGRNIAYRQAPKDVIPDEGCLNYLGI